MFWMCHIKRVLHFKTLETCERTISATSEYVAYRQQCTRFLFEHVSCASSLCSADIIWRGTFDENFKQVVSRQDEEALPLNLSKTVQALCHGKLENPPLSLECPLVCKFCKHKALMHARATLFVYITFDAIRDRRSRSPYYGVGSKFVGIHFSMWSAEICGSTLFIMAVTVLESRRSFPLQMDEVKSICLVSSGWRNISERQLGRTSVGYFSRI